MNDGPTHAGSFDIYLSTLPPCCHGWAMRLVCKNDKYFIEINDRPQLLGTVNGTGIKLPSIKEVLEIKAKIIKEGVAILNFGTTFMNVKKLGETSPKGIDCTIY